MNDDVRCVFYPRTEPRSDASGEAVMALSMMERLALSDGATVTFRLPGGRFPLRVVAGGSDEERIYFPRSLIQRAGIPTGWPLRLQRAGEKELRVGPFVGIFCQRYPGMSIYGPQTRFFRRLIELGRRMCMFVYVFETRDVDRKGETIAASTWLPGRGWVRRRCPLPHVFYDRGMVTPSVMRIHRWLRLRGVKQFNGYVGSKLWVYRLLENSPELSRHIPPTRVLRHPSDLMYMVQQHGTVYVKSAGGGKGIGIWVISPSPRGGYAYRFTDGRTRVHRGYAHDVRPIVRRLLSAPRGPWFIQPRLDLLRWRGRMFDARVLVQRDGRGRLRVTGTGARVGRKGSIVSNIHGGGDARPLSPLLAECLGLKQSEADGMQAEVERISLAIARIIDGAIGATGTVGELGVDIAIDRRGQLWILEANSRTGRNVFPMAGMHDRAKAAMERPLQYAEHVANFGN